VKIASFAKFNVDDTFREISAVKSSRAFLPLAASTDSRPPVAGRRSQIALQLRPTGSG
jgi:hypothetical protein